MRLWTIHPQYLDAKGLVALWREGLLAQAVLNNATRGYQHHPQLYRFRATSTPLIAIAVYLQAVADEAKLRNYNFAADKIGSTADIAPILATQGQLEYEWNHLMGKLQARAPLWYANMQKIQQPQPHPLFCLVPGEVATWEVRKIKQSGNWTTYRILHPGERYISGKVVLFALDERIPFIGSA